MCRSSEFDKYYWVAGWLQVNASQELIATGGRMFHRVTVCICSKGFIFSPVIARAFKRLFVHCLIFLF